MKHIKRRFAGCGLAICIAMTAVAAVGDESNIRYAPYKPDPPVAVDGDLGDWGAVPNAWAAAAAEIIAHAAWREECLFIAVEVKAPASSPAARRVLLALDSGQRHDYVFNAAGPAPEVACVLPANGSVTGITAASKSTAQGWTLEALVPFSLLDMDRPKQGASLGLEIRLLGNESGDSTPPPLPAAILAGADGKPVAAEGKTVAAIFSELRLEPGKEQAFTFDAPPCPEGQLPVLSLLARLEFNQVAGYAAALRLTLNGKSVDGARLLNKPQRIKARSGDLYSMTAGELLCAYYSPDFTSADTHPYYGPVDPVKTGLFELDLTGLLAEGANTLVIAHAAPTNPCALALAQGELWFMPPPPPPKAKAGPPTGPLPRIAPQAALKTDFRAAALPESAIEVEIGGETFRVESRFSTPKPEWVRGGNAWFSLDRQVETRDEAVVVRDTFTNLANENLPLMRHNEVALGGRLVKLWLAGLDRSGGEGSSANPSNPTTYAATAEHGIGLLPLDDVARLHVTNQSGAGAVSLSDISLVLAPGAVYCAEWAIIPTATPDYWAFLNAARRLQDANFTIDGAFAFLRTDPNTDAWTDQQLTDFLHFKDAKYACSSISYPMYMGRYTHGTSFQKIPLDSYKNGFARWKGLVPDIKTLVYFHCFIDVTDEGPALFADARLIGSDGAHANYGVPHDRIYIPTEKNSYGPEIAKNVDLILDDIKADGVYWDEHEYSRYPYHYAPPWDGFSGDIDPAAMTVSRLKSSVTLLSEPWRLALAKKILARGPLIGNGPPFTRAMAALHFPCFVETGSITNCVQAHLYSPIALGDHLTERSETDAYQTMLGALDFGCVYHWYNDLTVMPTHPQLTRYMYPITPLELHAGYIIGAERIITKTSGLYGWGDASAHEVHVFDDTGREVEGFQAPLIQEGGAAWTELRLAEGWSAAIVRR